MKKFIILLGVMMQQTLNISAQAPQLRADNIDEVMAAMTLEEKAQLLVGGGHDAFVGSGAMMGHQKKLVAGAAGITVADVLTGKQNPSGKLTMTWPIAATDHPSTANFPQDPEIYTLKNDLTYRYGNIKGMDYTNHEEDIYVGYRYFDTFGKQVAYPFGYGLSYTTFEYGKPTINVIGDVITMTVAIKNTGSVAGKEVVQLYVEAPRGNLDKPVKELKAFAKTPLLKSGERKMVTLRVAIRDLASFDEQGSRWLTEAGRYEFLVGASSRDIRHRLSADVPRYEEAVSKALVLPNNFQMTRLHP